MDWTRVPAGGWANYIASLAKTLETAYSERNTRFKNTEDQRWSRKAPNIPDKFKKTADDFRAPFVFVMIRQATSILANTYPVPTVIPLSHKDEDQKNSSLREKWLSCCYSELFDKEGVFYQMVDALVQDGITVFKVIPKRHEWGNIQRFDNEDADTWNQREERHRRLTFPFRAEHVVSSTFYPADSAMTEVLEITRRASRPLALQYNLSPDGNGKLTLGDKVTREEDWPTTSQFMEYWNPNFYIYLVDGEIVETGEHNYGRTPYFKAEATQVATKDPALQGISLAYPLVSVQSAINELMTIQMNWAKLAGFPVGLLQPISEDSLPLLEDGGKQITIIPGEQIEVPAGYRFEWASPPESGQSIIRVTDFLLNLVNQVSLSPVLAGILPGADVSGTTAATMIAVAKSILGPALRQLASAFDDAAGFIQECIEKLLMRPVPIWTTKGDRGEWLELGPSDIRGYYKVKHEWHPVIPAERYQEMVMLGTALDRGAVSMKHYREKGLQLSAPEEIDDEVFQEAMERSPQFLNYLYSKFLEAVERKPVAPQGVATPANVATQPGGPLATIVPGVQQPMVI